jgi:hypothetical protein
MEKMLAIKFLKALSHFELFVGRRHELWSKSNENKLGFCLWFYKIAILHASNKRFSFLGPPPIHLF